MSRDIHAAAAEVHDTRLRQRALMEDTEPVLHDLRRQLAIAVVLLDRLEQVAVQDEGNTTP